MDDTREVVGETNFVVSEAFLLSHWKECPICGQEENVEDFLEAYVPEDDGQYLYDLAKKSQNLIEDIGENLYKKEKSMKKTLLFRNWNEFQEPIEITVEIEGNAAIENEFVQMAASSIRRVTENVPGWSRDDLVEALCGYWESLGYTCKYLAPDFVAEF